MNYLLHNKYIIFMTQTCQCYKIYECESCQYKTDDIGCFESNKIKVLNKDNKTTIKTIYYCHDCNNKKIKEWEVSEIKQEYDRDYNVYEIANGHRDNSLKHISKETFIELINQYNFSKLIHIKKYGEKKSYTISLFDYYRVFYNSTN